MAYPVLHPGPTQIGVEGREVLLSAGGVGSDLLRARGPASVGIDRHHLDAGRGRAGQHDRRAPAKRADLDDRARSPDLARRIPQPAGLGVGEPAIDALHLASAASKLRAGGVAPPAGRSGATLTPARRGGGAAG